MKYQNKGHIFIVAQHRTGSTLLKNVLDKHSGISMVNEEMNFIEPFRNNTLAELLKNEKIDAHNFTSTVIAGTVHGAMLNKVSHEEFSLEQLQSRVGDLNYISVWRVIAEVLNLLGEQNSQSIYVGAKYPVHFQALPELTEHFPDAKVLILYRNISDVIASKLNDPSARRRTSGSRLVKFIYRFTVVSWFAFEREWMKKVVQRTKTNNFYELEYESLVSDPKEETNKLCGFMNVEFEQEMLYAAGKESSFGNINSRGISKKNVGNSKYVLSRFEWAILKVSSFISKILMI